MCYGASLLFSLHYFVSCLVGAAVSRRLFLRCRSVCFDDIKAKSSTKYKFSSFVVKFYCMPALVFVAGLLFFSMSQSDIIKRNRNPDMTHPCLTPVLTSNQSDSSPLLSIANSNFSYRA